MRFVIDFDDILVNLGEDFDLEDTETLDEMLNELFDAEDEELDLMDSCGEFPAFDF